MFDISALKEMKLSELQEIAKSAKTIKFNGVKKRDFNQSNFRTSVVAADAASIKGRESDDDKPKRVNSSCQKKKALIQKKQQILF
jgi:transcription termination factor Rho